MSWKAYQTKDFAYPFMRRPNGVLNGMRLVPGAGRATRSRSFFCCCPIFFALGVAGLGMVGGFLYLGIRFLGWA